ncbi:hypothetical protein PTKIN_Ptkin07bG0031100 [Pterospermum kingtungense]
MMFSKLLTRTDISERLAIPTQSLPLFPPFEDGGTEIELEVWDDDDDENNGKMLWKFICSIRSTGKYPKPVFSKGWLSFVKAKGLSVGDEVRLYKTQNRTKLFGNVVSLVRYTIEVVKEIEPPRTSSPAAAGGANPETAT